MNKVLLFSSGHGNLSKEILSLGEMDNFLYYYCESGPVFINIGL